MINGGDPIEVSGAPWLKGKIRSIGISSLTANHVFCSRHNSQLADLDGRVARFAEEFLEAAGTMHVDRRRAVFALLSGFDLERWMMKVLVGALASNNLAVQEARVPFETLPPEWQPVLLGTAKLVPPCGLYVREVLGRRLTFPRDFGIGPWFREIRGELELAGLDVDLSGFSYRLRIAPGGPALEPPTWAYRYQVTTFKHPRKPPQIAALTWQSAGT